MPMKPIQGWVNIFKDPHNLGLFLQVPPNASVTINDDKVGEYVRKIIAETIAECARAVRKCATAPYAGAFLEAWALRVETGKEAEKLDSMSVGTPLDRQVETICRMNMQMPKRQRQEIMPEKLTDQLVGPSEEKKTPGQPKPPGGSRGRG